MPDTAQFLDGFNLIPGHNFSGYNLQSATSTHEQITRYKEYQYHITLVFSNLGNGQYNNLYNTLMGQISQTHSIKAIRNFYFCSIDAPKTQDIINDKNQTITCLLYTSPSPRDGLLSRMPSS